MAIYRNRRVFVAVIALVLAVAYGSHTYAGDASKAPWVGKQLDGKKCFNPRPPPGGGPYNYLNRPAISDVLNMIENAHFHKSVEDLKHGSTGTVMADLDFVLLSFPNHHRGLNSSVRYSLKKKGWKNEKFGVPAECYLQRAMKYAPKDSIPFELYGYYMTKKGEPKLALQGYKRALKLRPTDVMLNYNTALLMAKQKEYADAMKIARPLYDAGLTLPGLRNLLIKAGKWKYSEAEIAQLKAVALKAKQNAAGQATDDAVPETADRVENGNESASNEVDNNSAQESGEDTLEATAEDGGQAAALTSS